MVSRERLKNAICADDLSRGTVMTLTDSRSAIFSDILTTGALHAS